jgi:hypothetical protein
MSNEYVGLAWLHFSALLIGYGVLGLIAFIGAWILVGTIQELWLTLTGQSRRPGSKKKTKDI